VRACSEADREGTLMSRPVKELELSEATAHFCALLLAADESDLAVVIKEVREASRCCREDARYTEADALLHVVQAFRVMYRTRIPR